jgi:uncharacterized protein (DUF2141 family)
MRPAWAIVAMALATSHAAHAATVVVTVGGVRNDHGHVLVALCTRASFLRPHCAWRGHAAAQPGRVQVRIEGVPPGTYAAQAFHDENDNGRLERTLLGLPKEAMGFSNDAPMRMGPPRFDAAAFTVTAEGAQISFGLRYFQ